MDSYNSIVTFVNDIIYENHDEWILLDIARIFFEKYELLDNFIVNEKSKKINEINILQFLLKFISNVNLNKIALPTSKLDVSQRQFDLIVKLSKISTIIDVETFECTVLFMIYPKYLTEQNLRFIPSNYPLFIYTQMFLKRVHQLYQLKLNKIHLTTMFCGENVFDSTPMIDALITTVMSKCTDHATRNQIAINFNLIDTLIRDIEVALLNKKNLLNFYNTKTIEFYKLPRLVVNGIVLILAKIKELTQNTTIFIELSGIVEKLNSNIIVDKISMKRPCP